MSLCGAGGKTTLMFALAREFVAAGERVLITTTTHLAVEEGAGPWPSFMASDVGGVVEGARRLLPFETGARAGAVVAYSSVRLGRPRLVGFGPEIVDGLARSGAFDRILVEADGASRKPLKAPADREPVIPSSSDALIVVAGLSGVGQPLGEETVFQSEAWARLTGLAPGERVTPRSLAQVVTHAEGLARGCPPHVRRVLFLNQADTPEREEVAREVVEALGTSSGLERVVSGGLLPAPRVVNAIVRRTAAPGEAR